MATKGSKKFLDREEYADQALAGCRRFAASAMRGEFSSFVDDVRISQDRVVITRHGRPVAGIVSLKDMGTLFEYDRVIDEGLAQVAVRPVSENEGVSIDALLKLDSEDDQVPAKARTKVATGKKLGKILTLKKRPAKKDKSKASYQVAAKG